MRKIRNAAIVAGIIGDINAPALNAENINAAATQTQNGNLVEKTTDPRWFDLIKRKDDQIAEKDAQINRLLSIIEKMQG